MFSCADPFSARSNSYRYTPVFRRYRLCTSTPTRHSQCSHFLHGNAVMLRLSLVLIFFVIMLPVVVTRNLAAFYCCVFFPLVPQPYRPHTRVCRDAQLNPNAERRPQARRVEYLCRRVHTELLPTGVERRRSSFAVHLICRIPWRREASWRGEYTSHVPKFPCYAENPLCSCLPSLSRQIVFQGCFYCLRLLFWH